MVNALFVRVCWVLPMSLVFACAGKDAVVDSSAPEVDLVPPVAAGPAALHGYLQLTHRAELYIDAGVSAEVPEIPFYAGASFHSTPYFPVDQFASSATACYTIPTADLVPWPTNVDVGQTVYANVGDATIDLARLKFDEETILYEWDAAKQVDAPAALGVPGTSFGWADHPETVTLVEPFEDVSAMMGALQDIALTGRGEIPLNTPTLASRLVFAVQQRLDEGHLFTTCITPDDGQLTVDLSALGLSDLPSIYRVSLDRETFTLIEDDSLGLVVLSASESVAFMDYDVP